MRIVVAIPYAPWPVTKGTDRLILNLLEGLSANHEVTLVTMALGESELARLREIGRPRVAIRAIVAPNRRSAARRAFFKARNLAVAALAGVPLQTSYAAPRELLRLIADAAEEAQAALVLASYWSLYRLPELFEARRALAGAKLVLVTHDLDYVVNEGRLERARGLARRAAGLAARMNERIERAAYERYGAILTMTPSDAEILRRHPAAAGKTVLPLPLAMDLAAFNPASVRRERGKILVLGMFHADFNRDALSYFLAEVFPLVRARSPEARVEVVGHGVEERLRAAAGPGVEFAGGVEDIRSPLGRASLMVLPLRFGGGVRIRMMEAAAMGTPVVSTPVGVAGMGLVAGRDYLEARSPEEMAERIVRLLRDEAEARRIGAAARLWAERNISMESYPERLEELISRLRPDA